MKSYTSAGLAVEEWDQGQEEERVTVPVNEATAKMMARIDPEVRKMARRATSSCPDKEWDVYSSLVLRFLDGNHAEQSYIDVNEALASGDEAMLRRCERSCLKFLKMSLMDILRKEEVVSPGRVLLSKKGERRKEMDALLAEATTAEEREEILNWYTPYVRLHSLDELLDVEIEDGHAHYVPEALRVEDDLDLDGVDPAVAELMTSTNEQILSLIAGVSSDQTLDQVAKAHGCSSSTVVRRLRRELMRVGSKETRDRLKAAEAPTEAAAVSEGIQVAALDTLVATAAAVEAPAALVETCESSATETVETSISCTTESADQVKAATADAVDPAPAIETASCAGYAQASFDFLLYNHDPAAPSALGELKASPDLPTTKAKLISFSSYQLTGNTSSRAANSPPSPVRRRRWDHRHVPARHTASHQLRIGRPGPLFSSQIGQRENAQRVQ